MFPGFKSKWMILCEWMNSILLRYEKQSLSYHFHSNSHYQSHNQGFHLRCTSTPATRCFDRRGANNGQIQKCKDFQNESNNRFQAINQIIREYFDCYNFIFVSLYVHLWFRSYIQTILLLCFNTVEVVHAQFKTAWTWKISPSTYDALLCRRLDRSSFVCYENRRFGPPFD